MDRANHPSIRSSSFGRQGPLEAADHSQQVALLNRALKRNRELLVASQRALSGIYVSREWKVLLRYRWFLAWLLPSRSRRRRVVKRLMTAAQGWFKRLGLVLAKRRTKPEQWEYRRWIEKYEPSENELDQQRRVRFPHQPRLSVVMSHRDDERDFAPLLQSLERQTYGNWELCLALDEDDAAAAADHPLVRVQRIGRGMDEAQQRNALLARASGQYVLFLDGTDVLAPFAFFHLVHTLQDNPDADLIYADEDRIDAGGTRSAPFFKPDWSPDALRSGNYIGQPALFRTDLLRQLAGCHAGALAYDLLLRVAERARAIVHVPGVLLHRQKEMRDPADAARHALVQHLERLHVPATVQAGAADGIHDARYIHAARPLVSILIPSHDNQPALARCLDSIRASSYRNVELILVENHSQEPETFRYYREIERQAAVRILTWERPFNFAAVNNQAAAAARGEVLLFLNNDVQAINPDWLERLLEHALRPEVGAVGARLYYPDDTVQHGGVLLGVRGIVAHAHRHFPRGSAGYANRLVTVHNVTAVTGACLMMRRDVFREVGGFDERLVMEFNDLDLCLKVRERGWWVVWTPHAELYHWESKTRGGYADTPAKAARFQGELDHFLTRWGDVVAAGDPFYNRCLSPDHEDFSLRR